MLKREFKEVSKQTLLLIISVFCLIYPIHLLASIFSPQEFVFSKYFLMFYQLFIFVFSAFLGISMFSTESRNDGFEYLLTLPFSRTRLLLHKIIPRIASLIFLYLIYLVLLITSTSDPFLFTPIIFTAIYFPLFFIATSLSVFRGNFVANSIGSGLLFILFLFAANLPAWLVIRNYFGPSESFKLRAFTVGDTFPFTPFSIVLLGFLIALPYVLSLFYGFKTYDIRSSKRYIKRFVMLFIPLMIVMMGISYLMLNLTSSDPFSDYFITKKGVVLKWSYSGTYVLDGEEERRLPDFYPRRRNIYQSEKSVYVSTWNWKTDPAGSIIRFDDKFSSSEKIYSPPEGKFLSKYIFGYGDSLIFLESTGKKYSWNKSSGNTLVFLNSETGEVKKAEFPLEYLKLVGRDESGDETLLIGSISENLGTSVYTLTSTGSLERILRSRGEPVFMNDKLITFGQGEVVFGRFTNGEYEELARAKTDNKITSPFYLRNSDLNRKNVNFLTLKIHKKPDYEKVKNPPPLEFVFLDLINNTSKRVSDQNIKRAFLYTLSSGEQVLLHLNDWGDIKLKAIYIAEGASFRLLKDFSGENIPDWSEFGMAGDGFGIGPEKSVQFYSLPDMKEIKY